MKILITHKVLIGDVKRRVGFSGNKTGRKGCTHPWSRLERVGNGVIDIDDRPFSGCIEFIVRQGGIGDERLSRHYKNIFREDVFPAIKNFLPDCSNVFRLTLIYNDDLLLEAYVEYIAA